MMERYVLHETECENCGEHLQIDVEVPPLKSMIDVYGDVCVKVFDNHVEISHRDWLKYKKQMISAWNKGDKKHATGNTEEGSDEK